MNETVVMNKIVTRLEAADIAMVLKLLPHRYPFLMVECRIRYAPWCPSA